MNEGMLDSVGSCRGDGGVTVDRRGRGRNCYAQEGGLVGGRWGSSFTEGMNGEVGGLRSSWMSPDSRHEEVERFRGPSLLNPTAKKIYNNIDGMVALPYSRG